MDNIRCFLDLFPGTVSKELGNVPESLWFNGEELRMRRGLPAILISSGKEYTISGHDMGKISQEILNDIINKFLNYSEYAHLNEITNGYISLYGGHRAGFCGQAVMQNEKITYIKNVSSINIRLAKDIRDCDSNIWPHIVSKNQLIGNLLIVSPPGCGKTTMLRSLIRKLSTAGYTVSVCDERMEISGAGPEGFSFDLGPRTDVLTGCSKEEGMILLLRSMGPQILATDEIGCSSEVSILRRAVSSGVMILTTIHGKGLHDVLKGPMGDMVKEGMISRIVFLTDVPKRGTLAGIWKNNYTGEIH